MLPCFTRNETPGYGGRARVSLTRPPRAVPVQTLQLQMTLQQMEKRRVSWIGITSILALCKHTAIKSLREENSVPARTLTTTASAASPSPSPSCSESERCALTTWSNSQFSVLSCLDWSNSLVLSNWKWHWLVAGMDSWLWVLWRIVCSWLWHENSHFESLSRSAKAHFGAKAAYLLASQTPSVVEVISFVGSPISSFVQGFRSSSGAWVCLQGDFIVSTTVKSMKAVQLRATFGSFSVMLVPTLSFRKSEPSTYHQK